MVFFIFPVFEIDLILVVAYILAVVLCIVLQAPLVSNSNRAGFIALAQLPVLFLFGTKNSILSILLGPSFSYDKLNFIHRWSGRLMFLGGLLHGSLWIRNHLQYGIQIIGAQKEESGIASFALLGVIVVSSVRGVRRGMWGVFWMLHILAFPAFFITVCYHTIYAAPWIFPPLAFYGFDLLLRMFKHRTLDAVLVPVDKQMTLVHIPHVTTGWRAGQHVRLRIFAAAGGAHIFESHPLSIYTAPPDVSCIRPQSMPALGSIPGLPVFSDNTLSSHCEADGQSEPDEKDSKSVEHEGTTRIPRGMSLGVRAVGDWSRAINAYAKTVGEEMREEARYRDEKTTPQTVDSSSPSPPSKPSAVAKLTPVPVQVTLDGPYGGCSIDLGEYETVLLFAGGAGATFTLGLLDDIVGRCVRQRRRGGEKTRRIEFAWCVRSFGSIEWFAPALMDIAFAAASSSTLDLHISIYVTCLCNPEAVPPIPNCDVTIVRPSVTRVLRDLTTPPPAKSGRGKTKAQTPMKSIPPASANTAPRSSSGDKSQSSADAEDADDDEIEEIDPEEVDEGVLNVGTRLQWVPDGGGLAVCASGPETLVREAANAVARIQMSGRGKRLGGVGLHTEVFMV
ncbi:hypothetical protein D9619_009486 [Psilocybe cf. subviscida]|uniref:FAD-binding FR-type domain-containing protein n=1 Tax=Psilocybe cf. subviscida TaxID=2480587 RepID=A0A8H5BUZ0_9AGAR|nr:hypothetical protein D9619_009486 [Psilocybe cf. subviscida]